MPLVASRPQGSDAAVAARRGQVGQTDITKFPDFTLVPICEPCRKFRCLWIVPVQVCAFARAPKLPLSSVCGMG